jgi:hypothetical protein
MPECRIRGGGDGFSGASAYCLSASAFILFGLIAGNGINGLNGLIHMPGDKFIPACRYYVGDAMLILHPHGEDSGALASSIVWLACACQGCPKNVSGAARRWFGLRLHR